MAESTETNIDSECGFQFLINGNLVGKFREKVTIIYYLTQVKGVVTQGRGVTQQFVKTFAVQVSSDSSSWQDIPGLFNSATQQGSEKIYAVFPAVVWARYVKLVVKSWNVWISMRAAALLCQA